MECSPECSQGPQASKLWSLVNVWPFLPISAATGMTPWPGLGLWGWGKEDRVKDLRGLQKSSVLLVPQNASGPGQSALVSPYWAPSILRRENKKETVMSRQRWNQDRGYGAVSGDSLSRL